MYLKSIEVHGFKSFAHKLVFEFHNGITAIVGPNGSGKSNVADAVRWVLGEQSAKQLRGSKMEDIIFSGTELRRPQGFAYVAITLDNSDHKLATSYDEVTIARRVYRSGESEYLMNGKNSRLRDVQELFLDTGIGKEGYSIIGQGQIDKILNGKPEERRELFDEAAGIVKFKKRKAAAEKNLDAEQQNLCRIQDILKEIENQIVPLEKQSLVAKEYLGLRDELKCLDVNMFLMEYDGLHSQLEETNKKSEIAENDLAEFKSAYDATKEEYERLEQSMEMKNELLDEKKRISSDCKIKKEKLEGEVKVLHEQILATRQNSEHYKNRITAVEGDIKIKKEQFLDFEKKQKAMEDGLDAILEEQKLEETKLDFFHEGIENSEKNIENGNHLRVEGLNERTVIKSKLQHFETMLEQNNLKRAELNQRLLKNKSDEVTFEENIALEKSNLVSISDKIRVILSNNEVFENDKNCILKDKNKILTEKNSAQQEFHREQSRLDSLKNMTERYDGYGQSIRRVMEQKEKNVGIIGVVADIVKVEKTYETAIETALGGNIQNIVTDNEVTAKNLIGFLKQNKFGRATFLPLTTISARGSFQNTEVLKEKGVIGLASTLVHADKSFDGLVDYLLGKILVVDQIEHAIALGKKYRQSLRMVTLEGDLISPGGSMSGGAYKNSSNLLSRRREMEDLQKKIDEWKEKIQSLDEKEIIKSKEFEKLQTQIEKNKNQLQELYLDQNTAKIKYDQAQQAKDESQGAFNLIARENGTIEIQITEMKEQIVGLKTSLSENERKNKENEDRLEEETKSLEIAKTEEEKQRKIVEQGRLTYSTREQNGRFIIENMNRIQSEIEILAKELEELLDNLLEGKSIILNKKEEILEVTQGVSEFEEQIQGLDRDIENLNKERRDMDQVHKTFFEKREELAKHMSDVDKEVFRLHNQKEKYGEQMENQMNYMWEEYELTYSSAFALKTEVTMPYAQIKKSLGELKNKIRALGAVNVNAIEDYKIMSERYFLLKNQHDDLVASGEMLKKIIEELDEEMRKQFSTKFQEIKEQFDIVFKEMFGGGKGTIELVEEEDILEAGIRIIAQPPGKKLQNMMQLSGGEKALTAISLLFAIQNLKPSPFCLLDEIEAALDDSNVSRYAKYLHKLTKHTQFIVITHRRGTMAAADRLYGITMQEKGVSTLVSVNLLEDDLEK
ncbi:MAG: chromosome segregation protein SMC [Acetivibrio sp.]